MTMNKFRCTGDIIFSDEEITPGQICDVHLKSNSKTCNSLQYLSPLTPEHPYFFAQIRTLAPDSKVTVGIAGPDIASNIHPGHWLNSVGYHSDTSQIYSSHQCIANTGGEELRAGDVLGVLVTYFGEKKSTVTFLKNGSPVATRFHFEPNHNHYFPTVALENGLISLSLMWPQAALQVPTYSETNMLDWICPVSVKYDVMSNSFVYHGEEPAWRELTIQSPHPLSLDCQHFEVVLDETEHGHAGPSIALAGCSPNVSPPVSSLTQDYIRFDLDNNKTISLKGHRIGWGIHYSPESRDRPDFNPNAEQLVYCYITADMDVISGQVIMQPEGGFYPVVILPPGVSRITVDIESNSRPAGLTQLLDNFFRKEVTKANREIHVSIKRTEVKDSMMRKSKDLEVTITSECCKLQLSRDKSGIHVVQFTRPLTEDRNYFLLCIRSLHEDSTVAVGVAGKDFPLNMFPGKLSPSVGWASTNGKLYRNSRHDGNLSGEQYYEGDMVGVEMEAFGKNMSVALFTKNLRPVGTVYYTQSNRAEFLPTISLCSNGYDVVVEVFWQNMLRGAPVLSVANLEHWCLPTGSRVDHRSNTVYVKDHPNPVSIQAPYSFHKGYNHFEVHLTKQFSPPPAIVLSTATPMEPPPKSCLKLDFLRFWAVGEASCLVQVGDLVGWGLLYIDDTIHHTEEQLVICYLTVNRKILLVRVVYQPPGGFYPLVVLPPGLNEVTFEFSATVVRQHPISCEDVNVLVNEAKALMEKEKAILENGGDPISELAGTTLFTPLPSQNTKNIDGINSNSVDQVNNIVPDTLIEKSKKTNKMAKTIIDSPFHGKKLTRALSRKYFYGDHKSSVSCAVL